MRWFWLFIALLTVLTGVLHTQRVRREQAQQVAMQSQAQTAAPGTAARRSRERTTDTPASNATASPTPSGPQDTESNAPAEPAPDASASQPLADQEPAALLDSESQQATIEEQAEIAVAADPETTPQARPGGTFNPGALVDRFNELGQQEPAEAESPIENALAQAAEQVEQETQSQQAAQTDAAEQVEEAAPSFELRGDGSFRIIEANVWVQGSGTASEPYVLGWDALKSIENIYDPKKGKDKLPDWLDFLDGKVVSIEGNTLVPVVATTTRELLIMKNPWDGCCIGVPPTPYDAVEVVLNHDVDFGNSAVGFGSVQGTFFLDPYIVDGWVLGLYIVEDARYRSGEGVVFPEF